MLGNPRSSRHTPLLKGKFNTAFQQGTTVFVKSYITALYPVEAHDTQLHLKVLCSMVLRWLEPLLHE